ncbi:hypothetical protein T492DRAFT_848203 [Pavlovales sp. CCMP2436]|nr:hypothetical protein T492DRAFT_848203 [Pavlovales sp. CCMP2436]
MATASLTSLYRLPKPPVLRIETAQDLVQQDAQGQTAYTWPSGAKYEGAVNADKKPHGRGAWTMAGCRYEGDWLEGRPSGGGSGRLQDAGGALRYDGELLNGVCHGFGTLVCERAGVSYTGQWANGAPHGRGRQSSVDVRGHARHTDGQWERGICTVAERIERGPADAAFYSAFLGHCVPRSHAPYQLCSPVSQTLTGSKRATPDGTPAASEFDFNRDYCDMCSLGGNLLVCEACPASFHHCCVWLEADEEPLGPYHCKECARRLWAKPNGGGVQPDMGGASADDEPLFQLQVDYDQMQRDDLVSHMLKKQSKKGQNNTRGIKEFDPEIRLGNLFQVNN